MQGIFEHGFVDCATDIPRIFRYGVGFHFYLGKNVGLWKIVGGRGSPSQQAFIWEKSRLLCPIQELTITLARALWVSRLDRVDPGGRAKVFLWTKLAWLGGCFYQRKSLVQLDGYHSSRANVCFSCKRYAKFCHKEKNEKLVHPAVAWVARVFSPYKQGLNLARAVAAITGFAKVNRFSSTQVWWSIIVRHFFTHISLTSWITY